MYPPGGFQTPCCLSLALRFLFLCSLSVFLFFSLKPRPSFNRSSICMRPDSHTQLPNNCLPCIVFLPFFFLPLETSFFRVFRIIASSSLYEEYAVRFSLPDDSVFLLCDNKLMIPARGHKVENNIIRKEKTYDVLSIKEKTAILVHNSRQKRHLQREQKETKQKRTDSCYVTACGFLGAFISKND